MRADTAVCLVALALVALCVSAGAGELPPGAHEWLKQNAVPIATLDPNAPFGDLQPLKAVLANVRIVQLGESNHGDGTTFSAKVRLIRFLHEEMGFNVLAFESGLYECEIANRDIQPGRDFHVAMGESIFGVWNTEEVAPLFAYLCRQAGTSHPLRLTGFDPQFSSSGAEGLVADLMRFLGPDLVQGLDPKPLEQFTRPRSSSHADEAVPYQNGALRALGQLRAAFDAHVAALTQRYGEREVRLCARVLENLQVWTKLVQTGIDEKRQGIRRGLDGAYTGTRDPQMADNLRWLAEEYYPDQKIIVWAHNFHVAHGFPELADSTTAVYPRTHPMGERVKQHFGDQVYTIGCCAYDGFAGWVSKDHAYRLPKPSPGSLESGLHNLGHRFAFVDLRGDGPLSGSFTCGFMEHQPIEGRWCRTFDGALFIDRMSPATRIGEKPFPPLELPTRDRPLLNGDVELVYANQPVGWSEYQGDAAGASCTWDRRVAHSGTASLCIARTDTDNKRLVLWSQDTPDGGPGRYVLSAFIKSEGLAEGASAAVCVQCRDQAHKQIGFATTQSQSARLRGAKDWTEVSVGVDAPEGTTSFYVFVFLSGAGKVWFDDIRLERK